MQTTAFPSRPAEVRRSTLGLIAAPLLLAVAGLALLVLVPPLGEFPVDDDWGLAWIVQTLVEQGRPNLFAWLTPTFVFQAYWGGVFAKMFGFSYTTLRFSTLVLAAVGLVGFYWLLRQLVGSARATLGALLLLFNPLFVVYSYSFMTEVPFLSLTICACALGVRALRDKQPRPAWILAAAAVAGCATLVRQLGALFPLSLLIGVIAIAGWRSALRPGRMIALLAPGLVASQIASYFERTRPPIPNHGMMLALSFWSEQGAGLIGIMLGRLTSAALIIGLFALPVTIGVLARRPTLRHNGLRWVVAGVLVGGLVCGWIVQAVVFQSNNITPFLGQALTPHGLYASFSFTESQPTSIVIPDWIVLSLTGAAILGSLLFIADVVGLPAAIFRGPALVPLLYGGLVLAASLPHFRFYDRYLLAVYPAALVGTLLAFRGGRIAWTTAIVSVVGLAACSVWSEREYLARRGAMWQAAQMLTERGIEPRLIDGGYEWNASYRGVAAVQAGVERALAEGPGHRLRASPIVKDIENRNAPYVVAFAPPASPADGTVIVSVPYWQDQQAFGVRRPNTAVPQR